MYKRVVCVLALAFCSLLGTEAIKDKPLASSADNEVMGYNPTDEGSTIPLDKSANLLWASDVKIRSFSNNYKNNTYTLERRSNGDLYVCFYNNDYNRVELHRSTNGGESWSQIWYKSSRECPSMVLTDNYVYVACALPYGSEYDIIVYKVSFSGTQQSYKYIATTTAEEYYPHITTDAEQYSYSYTYLYVVWSKTISSTEKDIWFSSLQESDLSFVINPKVIEGSGLFDWGDYLRARIDYEYYSNTDYLHLAFWDYDDDEIYYKRGTNYGGTWSSKQFRGDGQHPDINAYNYRVFLVYHNGRAYWSYSTSSGSSWVDEVAGLTSFDKYPRCHVTSGRWHVSTYYENTLDWNYTNNSTPSSGAIWYYYDVSDGTVPNASALDQDIYASSNTNVGLCWRGTTGAYFDASWRQEEVPPDPPSNCVASDNYCDRIVVTWQDNSNNEDGFRIYRNGSLDGSVGVNVTTYNSYPPAGTYSYYVKAYNSAGNSGPSNSDNGTRLSKPDAPSNCAATDDHCDNIVITWNDNSNNESGFKIYRDGSQAGSVGANVTTYTDTPEPGTYSYHVRAYNTCGNSSQSNSDNGTRLTSPDAPSDCVASDTLCNEVEVTWQDNSDNEDGFIIYRDGEPIDTVNANTESYTDDVSPGTYTYYVKAYNDCGESSASNSDDGTSLGAPDAPSDCVASDNRCNEVKVTWDDNSDNEDGFYIYRDGDPIDTVDADVESYTDDVSGGIYSYYIEAYSDCGESDPSNTGEGTSLSAPQADFTADTTRGEAPLTVNFTNGSTGDPTSWFWDFGNGQTSSSQNPTHVYDSAGTYTVSLTVDNDCGSDTETKYDYIVVDPPGIMEIVAVPPTYILYQNTPNPMVRETAIRYGVPDVARVNICIYDVSGRVNDLERKGSR